MVVQSKLTSFLPMIARLVLNQGQKQNISREIYSNLYYNQIRNSHARTMFIRPGKFYTKKYFDLLHFHFCLAGLPFLLFLAYQNFFVGPAALNDIPEGYEPRYWEYQKNPIKRFMSRYVFEIPERVYERNLHFIYEENCKQKMRNLENKVKAMMKENQDYKAWYYIPVPKETLEMKKEFHKKYGSLGYDSKFTE